MMQFPKLLSVAALLTSAKTFSPSSLSLKKYGNSSVVFPNQELNTAVLPLKSPRLTMALIDIKPVITNSLKQSNLNTKAATLYFKYAPLLEKFGISNQCLEKILSHWSAPHRFYHGLNHLEKLLQDIEQHKIENNLAENHPDFIRLLTTAFFHDVIYETLAKPGKNEDDSIEFYRNNIDLEHPDKWVEGSIESTKHRKPPQDSLKRTFWQFDNAVVYKNDARGLHQWEKEIRKEYQVYSYDAYKAGRSHFLKSCLDDPALFHSQQHLQNFENFIAEFDNIRPTIGIYTCKDSFNIDELTNVKLAESKFDLVYLLTKDESQKEQLKNQLQCKVTSDQISKIQEVADIQYI